MNTRTSDLARTQAWILAGGQGERLLPLTTKLPKPAVSFGGMFRIIDFTLSNCMHSGIGQVSLLTQYRYEELHRYVRAGWSELWNNTDHIDRPPLVFLPPVSGKRYRGTADSVFQNSGQLESDDAELVLILSGDHIYQMDYRGFLRQHAENGADLTIATVEHPIEDASHFGVVEVNGDFRVTGFKEKPLVPRPLPSKPSMALVSMGIYVFRKEVLLKSLRDHCGTGRGYDFGHDIIPSLIRSGRTYAYDFRNEAEDSPCYWRDIGTLDTYYKASMDLVDPDGPFDPYANASWPSEPARHPSFKWNPAKRSSLSREGCSRVTRSILAPDVQLADGVAVDDSVLMPGVRIGKGARLRRAIVNEGVHIPAGFQIGFDLHDDRRHHTITAGGVVVVSSTPGETKPILLNFAVPETKRRGRKRRASPVRMTA